MIRTESRLPKTSWWDDWTGTGMCWGKTKNTYWGKCRGWVYEEKEEKTTENRMERCVTMRHEKYWTESGRGDGQGDMGRNILISHTDDCRWRGKLLEKIKNDFYSTEDTWGIISPGLTCWRSVSCRCGGPVHLGRCVRRKSCPCRQVPPSWQGSDSWRASSRGSCNGSCQQSGQRSCRMESCEPTSHFVI